MRIVQRRYERPKVGGAPQQGFILNIKVASSTGIPTSLEIKQAMLDAGFPSYIASSIPVNSPSVWK